MVRVGVRAERRRQAWSTFLLVVVVVGDVTGTMRHIAANCPGVSDHVDNPLVATCTESDLTWESQTTVSYVSDNGTRFDYNNLFLRSRSTTGGCVRNCGTIASTETDPETGETTTRQMDFLTHPPIFTATSTLGGFTPERSMQFSTIVCDRSAASIASSEYNVNSTAADVYLDALEAAVESDSGGGGGRRRRLAPGDDRPAWLDDPAALDDMLLHETVADTFHRDTAAAWTQYREEQILARATFTPESELLFSMARPGKDVFVHRRDIDSHAVLASLPAIDADVWASAERAISPDGTLLGHPDAMPAVVSLALAKQRSKLAYLRDVYATDAEDDTWEARAAADGVLTLNPDTDHVWTLADQLVLLKDARAAVNAMPREDRAPDTFVQAALDMGVARGMYPPLGTPGHGGRRLVISGAAAMGVAATALVIGIAAVGIGSAALAQSTENRQAINQNARKLDAMQDSMEKAAAVAQQAAGTAAAAVRMAEASRDNARAMSGALDATSASVKALAAQATQTNEVVNDVYATVGAQAAITAERFSRVEGQQVELAEGIATVAAEANAAVQATYDTLSGDLQTMFTSLRGQDTAISEYVETTTGTIMEVLAAVDHRSSVNTNTVRSLSAAVYNANKQDTARRKVSQAAHTIWGLMEPNYWTPFRVADPNPDNEPEPDAWWAPGSPHRRLPVDTVTVYTVRRTTGGDEDVYDGSANHALHEDTYEFVCDASALMGVAMPWWTASDLVEQLGPDEDCMPLDAMPPGGIDAWVTDHIDVEGNSDWVDRAAGAPGCVCWMERASETCAIVLDDAEDRPLTRGTSTETVDGDPVTPDVSKHLSKAGLAGLGADNYDPCGASTPSTVTLSADEAVVTSFAEYSVEVRAHCDVPDGRNYGNLTAAAFEKAGTDPTDALPLGVAYFTSERLSAILPDNTYAYTIGTTPTNATNCGVDKESRAAAAGALTAAAVWDKLLSDAWSSTFTTLRQMDVRRYGLLETDTRVTALPFVFDDTTLESFQCWRVSNIATQGKLARVSRLRPQGIQKWAGVWMAPVAPSEEGASDGRPAHYVTQTDPEISIDNDYLLAGVMNSIFVGDPWCMFVPCDRPEVGAYANGTDEQLRYLYDVPQPLLSLAPDPVMRSGKATYLLHRDLTQNEGVYAAEEPTFQYTMTHWEEAHPGQVFDPTAAGADVAGFFKELVETPGGHGAGDVTCVGEPDPADGTWCSVLERFYFLVPDIVVDDDGVSGTHAYLYGTPAAQCADRSTGAFCLVPREWQAESQVTVPVGEVTATVGASCPMVDDTLLASTGIPTLLVTNPGSLSTEWYWDLEFRGPNATLDSATVNDLVESLPQGATHPCYGLAVTDQDGGVLAPRTTVNLQTDVSGAVTMCAQWQLTISITDPRTLLRKPCQVHNITANIGTELGVTLSVPSIDFSIDDSGAQSTIDTLVVPTTTSIDMDLALVAEYVLNRVPGGVADFAEFTSSIPGYTPSARLANISDSFNTLSSSISATAATQAAAASGAIATINNNAATAAAATAASQAEVAAATQALDLSISAVLETLDLLDQRLEEYNASVVELRNLTTVFVNSMRVLSNLTTAYASEVAHWGAEIGDLTNDIGNAVSDAASEAYDFVADNIPTGLTGMGGFLGSVVDFLIQAAVICAIIALAFFAYRQGWFTACCKKKPGGSSSNKAAGSGGTAIAARLGASRHKPRSRSAPKGATPGKTDTDRSLRYAPVVTNGDP